MQDDAQQTVHKEIASGANNGAWDLLESPNLSADARAKLVELAATARFHWEKVGTASARAHADLLYGWALARADAGAAGLACASKALTHFENTDSADWERAFAQAAMAQATWSCGHTDAHAVHWTKAKALGDALAEPDARYFQAAFATDRRRVRPKKLSRLAASQPRPTRPVGRQQRKTGSQAAESVPRPA